MSRNILFRADSSSTIGTGHIMRDLVLASKYKDANIIFAVQELEGNINHKIAEAGYKIETLRSNGINEVDKLIKKYSIDMIVIDHYNIDFKYEKQLKTQNSKLKILSFDDTYEKHYCDILLNHNIYADETRYKKLVPRDCEIRCGSNYTLIRDEFYEEKKIKREKIYDIFIAMGGADTQNLNIKLLEFLPKYFKIAIVTTTANKNLDALNAYVKSKESIDLYINFSQIAKLMNESKFAIVTPSVILNEIFYMKLPFLAIKTAENQEEMIKYLINNNYKTINNIQNLEQILKEVCYENCSIDN